MIDVVTACTVVSYPLIDSFEVLGFAIQRGLGVDGGCNQLINLNVMVLKYVDLLLSSSLR